MDGICSVCIERDLPFCKCPRDFFCTIRNVSVLVSSDFDVPVFADFCVFCKYRLVCPQSPSCTIGGDHYD